MKINPVGGSAYYALSIGDRLATYGDGGSYTYDTAGNVTRIVRENGTTLDLTWDSQYQLVSVSTNGAFAESYAYDALGRRISTTTLEGTLYHVYDDNWQCVADVDEQGTVVCSYVWGEGIDNLLAVKVGGNAYYPLTDIQGTVWGYADSANNVVARFDYDAWGNILASTSTVPVLARNRYRFQGREWSMATGLTNFRMRWYDAETGRWLSKDPIGLSGGLNLYLAFGNNSQSSTYPFGLVDMNLFPVGSNIRSYADRHNPSGVFSVGAHGNANGLFYGRNSIPAPTLARMIRGDRRYHRQPVQLDSCNVGNGSFAQQLANILGVEVRAPTRYAWYYPSGNVSYSGMDKKGNLDSSDPGELRSFMPHAINSFFMQ